MTCWKLKNEMPIFNFTALLLCLIFLYSTAFVTEPQNAIILPILVFLVFGILTTMVKSSKSLELSKFFYILILGAVIHVISLVPLSNGDVFWASKGAIHSILSGVNPYTQTYPVYNNAYVKQQIWQYLPVTAFFEMPFELFFNDLRYGLVFANIGISILIYLILRKKNEDIARGASTFYILFSFVLDAESRSLIDLRLFSSITDPIWVFFLLLTIYAYTCNKYYTSSILLGISMAAKQFSIIFFIIILLLWLKRDEKNTRHYKLIVSSLITAAIIILPFFITAPNDFIKVTTTYFSEWSQHPKLGNPQWNSAFIPQLYFWGFHAPIHTAEIIQIMILCFIIIYYRNKITNIISVVRVFTITYILILAFNSFTQFYYWLTVVPFLIISFALSFTKSDDKTEKMEFDANHKI